MDWITKQNPTKNYAYIINLTKWSKILKTNGQNYQGKTKKESEGSMGIMLAVGKVKKALNEGGHL